MPTLQFALEALAERAEEAGEHRLDQRLLGAEVIVHRRQVDPGLAGNQPQRRFGKALLGKQLLRSIENPLDGFRLDHDPPT
ncbi:hypothetical protein D3C80_1939310 [compost metagenome]